MKIIVRTDMIGVATKNGTWIMDEHDVDYYRQRAEQERAVAVVCEDGAVALVHLQLAEAYDGMVQTAAARIDVPARAAASLAGLRN